MERSAGTLKKSKLQQALIAGIILLAVFITACVVLMAFLTVRQGPRSPKRVTLRHPGGETLFGALTPEDMEQAVQLTMQSGGTGALASKPEAAKQTLDSLGQLILAGKLVELENGANGLLLESRGSLCKVQMTGDYRSGQVFWVPQDYISRPGGQTVGFCCASIYVRYIVTAAICGAFLYFFPLRSITMQILVFVFGMIILNLLWARLAMLLSL